MIVYAESSAVLAWLLGEPQAADVRELLAQAERVVASSLTSIECGRALARGEALGQLPAGSAREGQRLLDEAIRGWAILEMAGRALNRVRGRFPKEPVRTLDALHLSAALEFQDALGPLTMLSLDERIRDNGRALGMRPVPG